MIGLWHYETNLMQTKSNYYIINIMNSEVSHIKTFVNISFLVRTQQVAD